MNLTIKNLLRVAVPRTVRNWLRNPARSARYFSERFAYLVGKRETASPAQGWTLRCHPAAKDHFEVFRTDPIQASEMAGFASVCHANMRLLDLGAHYGAMSLAALHYGGETVRVVAVEASPAAMKILKTNVELNNAQHAISTVSCAVGDVDGVLEMLTTGPGGGDYFVVPTEKRNDTTSVPQKTIESIVRESDLDPTHIKIDIESFEYEVVLASTKYFCEHSPRILLEVHGDLLRLRQKDPSVIIRSLQGCGYDRFLLDDRNVSIEEMERVGFNCRLVCEKS